MQWVEEHADAARAGQHITRDFQIHDWRIKLDLLGGASEKLDTRKIALWGVRVRVEHVFGAQSNDMGGTLVRSVGLVRAKARIGLKNLAYNMRRLVQLERLAAAV